uniref:Complex III subunit 7 n=1 Tax=Kwoniella dejecticola CBS 10117 TaxID=1296121 RepID=A0A1A5ZU61_9TREE|nr:uncharacterized protein I303_08114 [Kwoniella dejecticola CBS 10117]OBR81344.1 hypothetical protein I303_08114 [Kwoniella dejecticola CBS 10117]
MPSLTKMIFGNGPLGPSFAPFIRQHPGVQKYWARWSNFYKNAAGYRQKGYLYDDLIVEETPQVQKVGAASGNIWVRRCVRRVLRAY